MPLPIRPRRLPLRRRLFTLLAAVATAAATLTGLLATANPAGAATLKQAPLPLMFVQGFDFSTCNLASNTSTDTAVQWWQNQYHQDALAVNSADTRGLPPAIPVPYKTCDNGSETASNIYDDMAASLGTAIAALHYNKNDSSVYVTAAQTAATPDVYTGAVNVLTLSLGGLVARRCLVQAARYLGDARFQPCTRILNLVMAVPPSHGTMFSVDPPVTSTMAATGTSFTCTSSQLQNYYVAVPEGCHARTADGCATSALSITAYVSSQPWSKVCSASRPTSDAIQQMIQGTGPLNVADETPWRPDSPVNKGFTHYYVMYSYSDEVVFLEGQQAPTAANPFPAHTSMLANAVNIAVPNMTHVSIEAYTKGSTTTNPLRLRASVALNYLDNKMYVTNATQQTLNPTPECATEFSNLAADIFLNKTFYGFTMPVDTGNYQLDCTLEHP